MLEAKGINELRTILAAVRKEGKRIAFVPTMGALHEGHLSLISIAKEKADVVVSSVFVNPTQFNDPSDFDKYPRTLEQDLRMLEASGCDVTFAPSTVEMYPEGQVSAKADYGTMTSVLEAAHRPGHFDGVVTIVGRLFDVVEPDVAIFGEKDYQQLAIIVEMCKVQGRGLEIIGAPIIREENGLAMSSRNQRLSESGKAKALALYKSLQMAALCHDHTTPYETEILMHRFLEKADGVNPEYFKIISEGQWTTPSEWPQKGKARALVAAWVEGVRLIDNLAL